MNSLTHLSLFSRIGSINLAVDATGFETVCQCEWADYPTDMLENWWPNVPHFRNITTLTSEAFYKNTVTFTSDRSPCKPFSFVGHQKMIF